MHIDDGEAGSFVEAKYEVDAGVRLAPSLGTLEITRLEALKLG